MVHIQLVAYIKIYFNNIKSFFFKLLLIFFEKKNYFIHDENAMINIFQQFDFVYMCGGVYNSVFKIQAYMQNMMSRDLVN